MAPALRLEPGTCDTGSPGGCTDVGAMNRAPAQADFVCKDRGWIALQPGAAPVADACQERSRDADLAAHPPARAPAAGAALHDSLHGLVPGPHAAAGDDGCARGFVA